MPAVKRIGARSIRVMFEAAANSNLEKARRRFIAFAKSKNAEIMAMPPQPTGFRRWVDGQEGAPEEAVRVNGVIRYTYQRLQQVVDYAMGVLEGLSPVLTGAYKANHRLFVNGTEATDVSGWRPGDEIVIANSLPYSRKIELGVMKMRVPGTDHVYQQAAQVVKRRMGNFATIRFTFRDVHEGGNIGAIRAATRGDRAARAKARASRRFPALVITQR